MDNRIIVLVGLSATGKDTVSKILKDQYKYNLIAPVTTRPMKDGEVEGFPYKFVDVKTFKKWVEEGLFIETRYYDTFCNGEKDIWYYGSLKKDVEDDAKHVIVLDFDGYQSFKQAFGNRVVGVYLYLDYDERYERAKKRAGFEEKEWNRRLADDNRRIVRVNFDEYDIVIENLNSLETAEKIIEKIER